MFPSVSTSVDRLILKIIKIFTVQYCISRVSPFRVAELGSWGVTIGEMGSCSRHLCFEKIAVTENYILF